MQKISNFAHELGKNELAPITINFYYMKAIKLILAAFAVALFLESCKTQTCPGYGEVENAEVEQNA